MADLERLLNLVRPSEERQPYSRWDDVEARLGFALPGDYKWLVDTYGAGSFDHFLYVLQPETRFEPIRLEPAVTRSAASLASLRAAPRSNVPFAEGELIPVAKTDNMDAVYWVRRPADDPDKWTIAVLEGGGVTWAEFAGGIVDYLGATFDGSFRVPFLPEDFPSDDLQFGPAPEAP
jgi:hypothetical protein